jgi:hypothetical protein
MHTLAPSPRSERFDIIFNQLDGQRVVFRPTPPIALDAADQPLAVVVDGDQLAVALSQYTECQRAILIKPPLQAAKNSLVSIVPSWSVSTAVRSAIGGNTS